MTGALCRRLAESGRKRPKRKKKTCRSLEAGSGAVATSAACDVDADQPLDPQSGLDSDSTEAWTEPAPPLAAPLVASANAKTSVDPATSAAPAAAIAVQSSSNLDHKQDEASIGHSPNSSVMSEQEKTSSSMGRSPGKVDAAKSQLEAAVTQATAALEVGTAAGDDVLQQVLNDLDQAIASAARHSISVKHSRKMRLRLHALLAEAVQIAASEADRASSSATAPVQASSSHQWQRAGAKAVRTPNSKTQPQNHSPAASTRHQPHSIQHQQLQQPNGLYIAGAVNRPTPPPPPPPRQAAQTPTQTHDGSSRSHAAAGGTHGLDVSQQSQSTAVQPRSQGSNPWALPAKHTSSGQVRLPRL